jgi:hypothetical protein
MTDQEVGVLEHSRADHPDEVRTITRFRFDPFGPTIPKDPES